MEECLRQGNYEARAGTMRTACPYSHSSQPEDPSNMGSFVIPSITFFPPVANFSGGPPWAQAGNQRVAHRGTGMKPGSTHVGLGQCIPRAQGGGRKEARAAQRCFPLSGVVSSSVTRSAICRMTSGER